jgi:hypothetical protein
MRRLQAAAAAAVSCRSRRRPARRRGGGNANAGIPLATNAILRNPEVYYGKQITVSAGVDRMLSKTAFVVDQWKMTGPAEVSPVGKPILVVAPYLTSALAQRNYLLMRGELVKFDTAALARVAAEYKIDLGPDLWAKYQGQPILLAASVLDSTYTELAKKPILPPTAGELAMSEAMKTISPAFALRVRGRQLAGRRHRGERREAQAGVLTDRGDLGRRRPELGGPVGARRPGVRRVHRHDAAAGNWDKVKFAAGKLNQVCGSCPQPSAIAPTMERSG